MHKFIPWIIGGFAVITTCIGLYVLISKTSFFHSQLPTQWVVAKKNNLRISEEATSSLVLAPTFTGSFSDTTFGFSLQYPSSWRLSTSSKKYYFTYNPNNRRQHEDNILILQKGALKIRIRSIGDPDSSCGSVLHPEHFYKQFDIGGYNAVVYQNPEINEPDPETNKEIQFQNEYYFPIYLSVGNINGDWVGDCITKINNRLYSIDYFVPKEFSNDQLDEFIAIITTLRWGL